MNTDTKLNCISEDFLRRVVDCINMALQDDLPRYLAEFQPDTTNCVPHLIGDLINTKIRKHMVGKSTEVIEFQRWSWKGKIIVDREIRAIFTIMREKRLNQLRLENRDKPHYLQSIVGILNADFIASTKQMNMFGEDYGRFDPEMIEEDFESIFKGQIESTDGYNHYAIVYDTDHYELTDISILLLDADLDEVTRVSLNEYIKPDFSKLTSAQPGLDKEETSGVDTSAALLSVRRRKETEATPVEIFKKQKQA